MKKIRLFKAIDHPKVALEFKHGHDHMLAMLNYDNVASKDTSWLSNPNVYLIALEDENGAILGGARLQIGSEAFPMPMHTALDHVLDQQTKEQFIRDYSKKKIAEICGIWNRRRAAVSGVGINTFMKSCIALAPHLGIGKIYGFGGAGSTQVSEKLGFKKELGMCSNEGIPYSSRNIKSWVVSIEDIVHLTHVERDVQMDILDLRNKLTQIRREERKRGDVVVHYDLSI